MNYFKLTICYENRMQTQIIPKPLVTFSTTENRTLGRSGATGAFGLFLLGRIVYRRSPSGKHMTIYSSHRSGAFGSAFIAVSSDGMCFHSWGVWPGVLFWHCPPLLMALLTQASALHLKLIESRQSTSS
eukprot:6472366-Amphidinium_carterae.1